MACGEVKREARVGVYVGGTEFGSEGIMRSREGRVGSDEARCGCNNSCLSFPVLPYACDNNCMKGFRSPRLILSSFLRLDLARERCLRGSGLFLYRLK